MSGRREPWEDVEQRRDVPDVDAGACLSRP